MSLRSRTILLIATVSLAAAVAQARGNKPSLEPGKYQQWGPDIDAIEIVKPFHVADYSIVTVLPFDTSSTQLPDSKEKSYESAKTVLNGYTDILVSAMKKEMKNGPSVDQAATAQRTPRTLIVRGTVDNISPGSRTKRYLAGYGAGSGGNKVHGEIVDAATGNVLVRFTQERHSGGTFKFGGGSDIEVMQDSIHAMGQDIVHIIEAFQ